MADIENIPEMDAYEMNCIDLAVRALGDCDIEDAINMLVVEKGLSPDVIREAATIVDIRECGDFDMPEQDDCYCASVWEITKL